MLPLAEIAALMSGWLTPALLILVAAVYATIMGLLVADLMEDHASQEAWRGIGSNEPAGMPLHATVPSSRIDVQYGSGNPVAAARAFLLRNVEWQPAVASKVVEPGEQVTSDIPMRPMAQAVATQAAAEDALHPNAMPNMTPATTMQPAVVQRQQPMPPKIALAYSNGASRHSSKSWRRRSAVAALQRTSRSTALAVPIQAISATTWPRRIILSTAQHDADAASLPEREHDASPSTPSDPDIRGPPVTRRANRARSVCRSPDEAPLEAHDEFQINDDLGDSIPVTTAEIDAIETYLADDLRDLLGVSANEQRRQRD